MKYFLLGLLLSGLALAQKNDLVHRPKSFSTAKGKAVFVDFITADYDISYNSALKSSSVTATIKFNAPESGHPIFDSVEAPLSIKLNGKEVTATETRTPSSETTVRVVDEAISSGSHTLVIQVPLKALVDYTSEGIKSAFWTSDLSERNFLERYMPANLEYDQVKMTFSVSFEGGKNKQKIYTNGVVRAAKKAGKSVYKITYPSYFNASSIFFHTVPEGATNELEFSLRSVDGRNVPVVVYTSKSMWGGGASLDRLKTLTTEIFHELEGDYGAWPHPTLVIYNAGSGGMEYCGATMTSTSALGHELFHSYFARGVMPANGNSGWLDEALASWRDSGYQTLDTLSGRSMMSAHPYYTRTTDRAAYSFGERFMRLMDGKLKSKGGLKPFMRYMVEKRALAPLFVEEFIKEMSEFYGVSVEEDFKKYTYGTSNTFSTDLKSHDHKIHRKMTIQELQNYL
ncbi:MAG: hypothetical protein ACLGHN_06150 [Bacteriovoracia bacterium]